MLKGHSGCTIEIIDGKIVKRAINSQYPIDRLRAQKNKQNKFINYNIENIHVPKIYDESYSIQMEYCPTINILQFLTYASIDQIDKLCEDLICFITFLDKNSQETNDVHFDLMYKYNNIKLKYHNSCFDKYLNKLLPDKVIIPIGLCHGDLTLSNILIDSLRQHIVLIDFLDSFIESPIIDIVKLRQDTKHYWTCFIDEDNYDQTHIKSMLDYMDKKLMEYFITLEYYNKYYKIFQFINFMRIMPYSRNQQTTNYLTEQIECLV